MAQDYNLIFFKAGDFKDDFGNTWCEAAFEGISEPVRWVVKDPSRVVKGQKYYGEIYEATGKKTGKAYLRFKTVQRPDEETKPTSKAAYSRDDAAIQAQWAIGQAKDWVLGNKLTFSEIEPQAKSFFAMIDRVKNSTVVASTVQGQNNPGPTHTGTAISDAEFMSLASLPDTGEPDFSDIPY
ncbi:MAG: hypothetical protein NVS1B10_01420 [Candidatus Saccharimonadales bacterium]